MTSKAAVPDASWSDRLRLMLLRETQVRASLETHAASAPPALQRRYEAILDISERRLRALETALGARGRASGGMSRRIPEVRGASSKMCL